MAADLARRVMERADALAAFTEEPGRITRAYGTRALVEARAAVAAWMRAAGMQVRDDAVGNLVGRLESATDGAGTIVLGSHIDSVRNAGRYDGPLGVLVAIAAIEALAGDELPCAVEVVAFADEEGLRYRTSYLGSRVFAGIFDSAELASTDTDGVTLADAVHAMGGDPGALAGARRPADDLIGYCEVHIEQGPVLESKGLPVGIVSSIAGQSRGLATFHGTAGHAGTVPMELRRDALCGAAEWLLAVEQVARAEPGLIATVGQASVSPCVGNVIPGEATLSYDVRHQDDAVKVRAVERLSARAQEICSRRGLRLQWEALQEHDAVPCSPQLAELLGEAVESTGAPRFAMPSGAGHDTVSMAHLTEVAMLFVRCRAGISHHPDESVEREDVAAAIDAMAAFLRLVGRAQAAPPPPVTP